MRVFVQLDGTERRLAPGELDELVYAGVIGPDTPMRLEGDPSPEREGSSEGERAPPGAAGWFPARRYPVWADLQDRPAAWLPRAWERPAVPWVTALVCGLSLRIFAWGHQTEPGYRLATSLHRASPQILELGESWRLLTYGVLHASFAHIANNVLYLGVLGVALEVVLGWEAVAALFVGSVVTGGTVSGWMAPDTPAIGASAGDFGFFAAAAVFGARFGDLLPPSRRTAFSAFLALFALWAFAMGLRAEEVDNWGHAGGLGFGLLAGAMFRPATRSGRRHNQQVALGMASGCTLLLLCVAAFGPGRVPLRADDADGVHLERPAWWTVGRLPTDEPGWRSATGVGLVGAHTTRAYDPLTAERAEAEVRAAWTAAIPAVVIENAGEVRRDGVLGRRLRLRWQGEGGAWEGQTWVFARGRYLTTVTTAIRAKDRQLRARVEGRLFETFTLVAPAAVAEARAEPVPGARSLLARAQGAADLGELDEAWRLYAEARALAPGESRIAEAWLRDRAAYRVEGYVAEARATLAAAPGDRNLRATVAGVLADAGEVDEARAVLVAGLALAPGDRTLDRALRELPEGGAP